MPECRSLALARNLNDPDWWSFSHNVLFAALYDWNALPVTATGAATETFGALLSTVTVLIVDVRVCPTLSVATASTA
jgi:hypothetical protein